LSSSLYESPTSALVSNNNAIDQSGLNGYGATSKTVFESNTAINASYTAAATSSEPTGGATVQTSSTQQTNAYLSQSATDIYNDPNPQIVRRSATGGPVTYQQKILVRFLQPPALPPPGVIKQIF